MPNDHHHDHGHDHNGHSHDHNHDHDDGPDPDIQAGWEALEAGDVAAARAAARAAIGEKAKDKSKATDGRDVASPPAKGARGRTPPAAKGDDGDAEDRAKSRLIDGLLLDAACAREEGDIAGALGSLSRVAAEDSEWCTPELWMGEMLSEDPERLDEALRHARRALDLAEEEDEYLGALSLKAAIELDLGRPTEARKTLEGLPPVDAPLEDPEATLDFSQLLMDAGDLGQARTRLETLTAASPELGDGWYLLGACAEMQDDEEAKRAAWVKTRALDLESAAAGAEEEDEEEPLTEDTLVAVAEETLAGFPDELRGLLTNVPIVVAEVPAAADVATGLDPRLLGLFSGTPHAESAGVLDPPQLTEIVLFRRNLERTAPDEDTLREEVRVTLLHEAGHFFGLDEAALSRLGLE